MKKNVSLFNKCCGCGLCVSVCSQNAISLKDKNGFLTPIINEDKCISCRKCLQNCSLVKIPIINEEKEFYIGQSKNKNILMSSSSGGIFSEIAMCVLEEGGVVYGSAQQNLYDVETIRVDNVLDLEKLRYSKYSQTNQNIIYKSIVNDLMLDKPVLICSTPCFINALNIYLDLHSINTSKLITIDFLCSGFIDKFLIKRTIQEIEKTLKLKIKTVHYRHKRNIGWKDHSFGFVTSRGYVLDRTLFDFFASHYASCEACLDCNFISLKRVSDITIGDAWGNRNYNGANLLENGISIISVNSIKGENIVYKIKNACMLIKQPTNHYNEARFITKILKPRKYSSFQKDKFKLNYFTLYYKYVCNNNPIQYIIKKALIHLKIKKIWSIKQIH